MIQIVELLKGDRNAMPDTPQPMCNFTDNCNHGQPQMAAAVVGTANGNGG
eukprot:CAMPEP_0202714432 /NCGR_PEP_ID=MMETSP1385-20130828/72965_1 /ASSEMBLY_ACC=CAM_ASM_000861 /TAXON_ID=933848 /ORGANISM="Elphidium margaritaceum" /LENGTH=49 /DNA_ID= /DNA_START= /DNA_END= /DNA_ORIENTATION=